MIWLKCGLRIIYISTLDGHSRTHAIFRQILRKFYHFDLIQRHSWRHLAINFRTLHTARKAVYPPEALKTRKLHKNRLLDDDNNSTF